MVSKQGLEGGTITQIGAHKTGLAARNLRHSVKCLHLAVGQVVHHYHVMTGVQQLHTGVTPDVTRSAGDQYSHTPLRCQILVSVPNS